MILRQVSHQTSKNYFNFLYRKLRATALVYCCPTPLRVTIGPDSFETDHFGQNTFHHVQVLGGPISKFFALCRRRCCVAASAALPCSPPYAIDNSILCKTEEK